MTSSDPIILRGRHLGERYRHLNTLVIEAYSTRESLERVLNRPESGPVDRLYKIDLASKHKHVDYMLENLRHDDMLYVSRALKATWLLEDEYQHIMNPDYLENMLYPTMTTPAVNKTKHWIHLNLRDPTRCLHFYQFYSNTDTNIAIKFLSKCSAETVEKECSKWFDVMTPEYFKIFCERNAVVAKLFFENLQNNKALKVKYFKKMPKYFEGLKCILKSNIDIYLDIIENLKWQFPHVSRNATKFIMRQKKDRFLQKSELYSVNILHMETLAQCLSPEDCENLVLKLARAKFLDETFNGWFTYQNVEPLIKRLDETKRENLKKRVFVQKNIGDEVKVWPYPISEQESSDNDDDITPDVFEDVEDDSIYSSYGLRARMKCCHSSGVGMACRNRKQKKHEIESFLVTLFEEYRYMNFDETLKDLQKKMAAESLVKNRMSMFLVLVSKSGGKTENLKKLIEFMTLHRNEPANVRAAIVRSLVKRASIWRAPDYIWEPLLIFAEGLGLDGAASECQCVEGLHAVVIRTLLTNAECESAVKTAFQNNFSTMTAYSLTPAEKDILFNNLAKLLLDSARTASEPYEESCFLLNLLDTIKDYKRTVESDLIVHVKEFARRDKDSAQKVLYRLFNSRIGRRELFKENFGLIQTADSYMNALKHDTDVLVAEDFAKLVITQGLNAERFLRKINIYFTGTDSLRERFLKAVKAANIDKVQSNLISKLARATVYLIGNDLKIYIEKVDAEVSKESKVLSAQMRAHAHVARPGITIDCSEWRQFGAKQVANRVLVCRQTEVENNIKQLVVWKRTVKLAIILSKRTNNEVDTLAAVVKIRPTVALKCGLAHIRQKIDKFDIRVWETIKSLIPKVTKKSYDSSNYMRCYLTRINEVPEQIKPELVALVFPVINEFDKNYVLPLLYYINILMPNMNETFVETILLDYLDKEFVIEKMSDKIKRVMNNNIVLSNLRILAKYLLLSKTEEDQTERFEKVGLPYLQRLEELWKSNQYEKLTLRYVDNVIRTLKYMKVFMSEQYVDSIPVMSKIATWMQSILPMERYFSLFVDLHLTMCFCRAIRQSLKQAPQAYADEKTRLSEGVKIVGEIYGKYIGHEAHELRNKYFDSIIELYGTLLSKYLENYFNSGIHKMEPYIMRSLLETREIESYLAFYMFTKNNYQIERKQYLEIKEIMKLRDDQTSKLFYYSMIAN